MFVSYTGESGLDVYSRVTSFLATLYADFADESIKVRVVGCWRVNVEHT